VFHVNGGVFLNCPKIMHFAAPDLGGTQGARTPHHVHVFSHMCDMCVPLGRLLARKVCL